MVLAEDRNVTLQLFIGEYPSGYPFYRKVSYPEQLIHDLYLPR